MTTYFLRGIRGATTVEEDSPETILQATRELLEAILEANELQNKTEDIANIFFTTTTDLNSVFPAKAARDLGLTTVPLMCAQEIPVHNSLPKAIRILLQVNTTTSQKDIKHVFLRQAKALRPDLLEPT